MLIQREEGNTAYRDIGPEMERELLNHLGDAPIFSQGEVSMPIIRYCACSSSWDGLYFSCGLISFTVHRCPCHGAPDNSPIFAVVAHGSEETHRHRHIVSQVIWLQLNVLNP